MLILTRSDSMSLKCAEDAARTMNKPEIEREWWRRWNDYRIRVGLQYARYLSGRKP